MKNLTDTDKAYLAGFMDGEGYVGIVRQRKKATTQQAASWLYHPWVILTNTDEKIIKDISAAIQMGKKASLRRTAGCKLGFQLKITNYRDLITLLDELRPYLRLKQRQADLVYEFCKFRLSVGIRTGRGSRGVTSFGDFEETIFLKLLQLNKRGA